MMSLLEYQNLEYGQKALALMRAGSSSRIESITDLKNSIAEYVHLKTLERIGGVRLMTLNRKFLRCAQRFEISVEEVANTLVNEGVLQALYYEDIGSYASVTAMHEIRAFDASLPEAARPDVDIAEHLAEFAR